MDRTANRLTFSSSLHIHSYTLEGSIPVASASESHFWFVSTNSISTTSHPNTIFFLYPSHSKLSFPSRTNSPFFLSFFLSLHPFFPSFIRQCNCPLSRNRKELPQTVKEPVVKVSFRRQFKHLERLTWFWVVCAIGVHTYVGPIFYFFHSCRCCTNLSSSKLVL